jgi:hypothetical protein
MSLPPTIQTETNIDLNLNPGCEFITFNYKGDGKYYSNQDLRQLTSGILPVVVYPSISPFNTEDIWTPFFITMQGKGTMPSINPNKPYNDNICPKGWTNLSKIVNEALKNFIYKNEKGGLLPQSNYIKQSIKAHPSKTVSLFCGLYTNSTVNDYIFKINIDSQLTFYVLDIQNGN